MLPTNCYICQLVYAGGEEGSYSLHALITRGGDGSPSKRPMEKRGTIGWEKDVKSPPSSSRLFQSRVILLYFSQLGMGHLIAVRYEVGADGAKSWINGGLAVSFPGGGDMAWLPRFLPMPHSLLPEGAFFSPCGRCSVRQSLEGVPRRRRRRRRRLRHPRRRRRRRKRRVHYSLSPTAANKNPPFHGGGGVSPAARLLLLPPFHA